MRWFFRKFSFFKFNSFYKTNYCKGTEASKAIGGYYNF